MAPDDRIRELAGQLFRAENSEVIENVAAQLHVAIDEYVAQMKREPSSWSIQPSPLESPA